MPARICMATIITVLLSSAPAAARQQRIVAPTPDQAAVLQAVAEHVIAGIRANDTIGDAPTIALATSIETWSSPEPRTPPSQWDSAAIAPFARILDARLVAAGDVYRCHPDDLRIGYCTLHDAEVLLILGEPEIRGDTALTALTFIKRFPAGVDPHEAFWSRTLKELHRREDQWIVVRNRVVVVE